MNIVVCEDSMEGILTAIYECYEKKLNPTQTQIQFDEELTLFARYFDSTPSKEKTRKVERTLIREFGSRFYYDVGLTLASTDPLKAQAVYQTIALGLTMEKKACVMECLSNQWVLMMFRLSQNVAREEDHMRGFLRFEELDNGILYSKIGPKNHIIGYLAEHFSDRLPQENFVIFDEKRNVFVIHPKGEEWYFVTDQTNFNEKMLVRSREEETYQNLFRSFCKHISIEERENLQLQRNMLPLRFRPYMTEFAGIN